VKNSIKSRWNSLTEPQRQNAQKELNLFKQPEYLDYINYLKGDFLSQIWNIIKEL
jgi:hypothetical protein